MRQNSWVALSFVFFTLVIAMAWLAVPKQPHREKVAVGEVEIPLGVHMEFPIVVEVPHGLDVTPDHVALTNSTERPATRFENTAPFFLLHNNTQYVVNFPPGAFEYDSSSGRYEYAEDYLVVAQDTLSLPYIGNLDDAIIGTTNIVPFQFTTQAVTEHEFVVGIYPSVKPFFTAYPLRLRWMASQCPNCEDVTVDPYPNALVTLSATRLVAGQPVEATLYPSSYRDTVIGWQWQMLDLTTLQWEDVPGAVNSRFTPDDSLYRNRVRAVATYSGGDEQRTAYSVSSEPVSSASSMVNASTTSTTTVGILESGGTVSCIPEDSWRYQPLSIPPVADDFPPNYSSPYPTFSTLPSNIPLAGSTDITYSEFFVADPDPDAGDPDPQWVRRQGGSQHTYQLTNADVGSHVLCIFYYYRWPAAQPTSPVDASTWQHVQVSSVSPRTVTSP